MTFAKTPEPPYYAVIFSSKRTITDEGYARMSEHMVELAHMTAGCIGVESARDADGFGITVSYWQTEKAITAWKMNIRHLAVQQLGKEKWYEHYKVRIAK